MLKKFSEFNLSFLLKKEYLIKKWHVILHHLFNVGGIDSNEVFPCAIRKN